MSALIEHYLQCVEDQLITHDSAQLKVVETLQGAIDQLESWSWLPKMSRSRRGVYIWGVVGAGKSWLMEQFFKQVLIKRKIRFHFHEFMEWVHGDMSHHQQQVDPLKRVAQDLAEKYQLICIDEFHITEIADAMLLSGILEELFNQKVMLVATANHAPDRLYEKGFHRELFLPAIELLKQNMIIAEVKSSVDYRMKNSAIDRDQLTHEYGEQELEHAFQQLSGNAPCNREVLKINQHILPVVKVADRVVWLDFQTICSNPRATRDYIELAQVFSSVIISNINAEAAANESYAWRFLHFVDELYDHHTQLVISTMGQLMQVYQDESLRFQFTRTISRLYEMQGAMVQQGYLRREISQPG
ncbi:MAG: cell division protein ZapE [Gammaproteobacteria bacterium]|nr:cell division protein ZapE [Gammaproteobacteria bacterium]MBT3489787.1 cell division protein ZapE [Gammaproteobacteria bacterium]MBT3717843.1 cell division protein ZapE [Gammaproteobacteria bacterium]MBT3844413.1 cell division protein ZapE [Gammaproteobacteria bacterium]MBT3892627.1 cell division protein ZapE [Gammaproteobacteria bacterium]